MTTPESDLTADGRDPYPAFKYRVIWNGKIVAGVSKVSGLSRAPAEGDRRGGGIPAASHPSPGQTDYEPITLERGVTYDRDFEAWANKVWSFVNASGQEVSLKDFRQDVVLEQFDEAGQKVMTYTIHRCWVSEYTAFPDLDGDGATVAIQSMTLQHEGWERATAVAEPTSPSE